MVSLEDHEFGARTLDVVRHAIERAGDPGGNPVEGVEDVPRENDGCRAGRFEECLESGSNIVTLSDGEFDGRGSVTPQVQIGENQHVPVLVVHRPLHQHPCVLRHGVDQGAGSKDGVGRPMGFLPVPGLAATMTEVLEDKRTATRFRILVEIADRQPAVSQGEIASAVGVTSQAVSEYIRDLDEEGFVEKEGRSRYRVTNEGVDWLLRMAGDVRRFADRVTDDVLGGVYEDAAIATGAIEAGDVVTLSMKNGLLHATPGETGPATGIATTDAAAGEDVGVSGFEGVIDFAPGSVTLYQVPPVRSGGSQAVEPDRLEAACEAADLVMAAGVEAVVTVRAATIEPATTFATGEVAAAAAQRGVQVVIVVTADEIGRVTDPLRDAGTSYEVSDWPE